MSFGAGRGHEQGKTPSGLSLVDEAAIKGARILVVDDQQANVLLLQRILEREGYRDVGGLTDPIAALEAFDEYQPDLLLLDLLMPGMDGFEFMSQIGRRVPPDVFLPILVLTADATPDAKRKSLSGGAKDFLTKPFDATEVALRIRNLLETRLLHVQLKVQNEGLEEKVTERTWQLEEMQIEVIDRLARVAEIRDYADHDHTERVGRTSALIARTLGFPEEEVRILGRAASLHDIGKVAIPDAILLKPGKLTDDEFAEVQKHTGFGAGLLAGGKYSLLKTARIIAESHHERWDGSGYSGLEGQDIPIEGRIAAVADSFDALTHDRPFRSAFPKETALAEMESQSGRQFDPDVFDAFRQVVGAFEAFAGDQ